MDPRAFLHLAKRLIGDENNPEGLRSTVSRAYYAAFHVATEFLKEIGCGVPSGPQGHELTYHYLNNCGDAQLVAVAGDLHDLRGDRNDADYKLSNTRIENEGLVQNLIEVADEIITVLDGCSGQRKLAVTSAVRAYKQKAGR